VKCLAAVGSGSVCNLTLKDWQSLTAISITEQEIDVAVIACEAASWRFLLRREQGCDLLTGDSRKRTD
jgi:hypothetical protein